MDISRDLAQDSNQYFSSPTPPPEDQKKKAGRNYMAKVIEFYIPERFRKKSKWIPEEERGKVIEFRPQPQKSALTEIPPCRAFRLFGNTWQLTASSRGLASQTRSSGTSPRY
jgi:hypothetical protein